ncbi:hypothetical protein CIG75_17015 [Tumebacillus algifaecis]|uniref:Uncharacterized protein n=1 Tax=Tumebacillus algifaecis TaxID=1214604 RepID=A0A223D4I0_9BACL|nr:hypothetical protein [Tumebacillus algifaecis]ASS76491.1 hypothetical protein CIG75_17015 [Tumebacillus algifaecis]
MPYVPKTDWNYNDVLSEKDINRIEGGIAEGRQLIEDHAAEKNNPHGVTPQQIGAETPTGAQAKVDAHVNTATAAHPASAIKVDFAGGTFSRDDLESVLMELTGNQIELFTSVDNGKAQVAAAVVAKGGTVAGTAPHSFQELANGIAGIITGKRFASGTAAGVKTGAWHKITVTGLGFQPSLIIANSLASNAEAYIVRTTDYINGPYRNSFWEVSAATTYMNSTLTQGTGPGQFLVLADGFEMLVAYETVNGSARSHKWLAIE